MAKVSSIVVLLWTSAANAQYGDYFQRWQYPHHGCGQWSACYVRALSREHMSGMVTRYSPSRWSVR